MADQSVYFYLIMKPYNQHRSIVNPDSNKIPVDLGTLDGCVGNYYLADNNQSINSRARLK
jgi:hypothetical protein